MQVACNLKEPSSLFGGTESVLKRVELLAKERGVAVSKAYTTNPLPQELDSWRAAGGPERLAPFDWRVPPGDEPFV